MTGVPATTLDEVGAGDVQAVPRKVDASSLTARGKPKVLYVGAEAVERARAAGLGGFH